MKINPIIYVSFFYILLSCDVGGGGDDIKQNFEAINLVNDNILIKSFNQGVLSKSFELENTESIKSSYSDFSGSGVTASFLFEGDSLIIIRDNKYIIYSCNNGCINEERNPFNISKWGAGKENYYYEFLESDFDSATTCTAGVCD